VVFIEKKSTSTNVSNLQTVFSARFTLLLQNGAPVSISPSVGTAFRVVGLLLTIFALSLILGTV
jgi:hypothetical protein